MHTRLLLWTGTQYYLAYWLISSCYFRKLDVKISNVLCVQICNKFIFYVLLHRYGICFSCYPKPFWPLWVKMVFCCLFNNLRNIYFDMFNYTWIKTAIRNEVPLYSSCDVFYSWDLFIRKNGSRLLHGMWFFTT